MSDNKREQERNELYRTIWTLANELRGSVDGWDFKQYVLGMLFYRYISENLTSYINKGEWDAGNNEFDYAKIDDDVAESIRDEMVQEKGFFIKPTELFNNLLLKIRKEDKDVKEKSEKNGKKERINDDIVFEIELIKQVEVNIDYILMLVAKYHESNCEDKTILANINKSIDASVELRSKKALIEGFVAQMTVKTDVERDWKDFVKKQKEGQVQEK